MAFFDREELFDRLVQYGLEDWAGQLRSICTERLSAGSHGDLPRWLAALKRLPQVAESRLDATGKAVRVSGVHEGDAGELQSTLMEFHPWRKGPFELFGVAIDTEWRSDWKWNRFCDHVDFAGKKVLDVGCGNGYYGWRMLAAGAELVIGCDPLQLYIAQFEVVRRYARRPEHHFVLPLYDHELPDQLRAFDLAFSMGVLYHRSNPIGHLRKLYGALNPGGRLVLETLVLDSVGQNVLVPEGRYAKMRNVWFIPSVELLCVWLQRSGFRDVQLIDLTPTNVDEQRQTEWMTFESLSDFLDPGDSQKTIEGYPAPLRATIAARIE